MRIRKLFTLATFLCPLAFGAQALPPGKLLPKKSTPLPPEIQSVLNAIQPGNLRGNLSFLASDALQGRYTPSPGLDVAAEFIASRFRASGLEPGGPEFFQVAHMIDRRLPRMQTEMTLEHGGGKSSVAAQTITVLAVNRASRIEHAPALVFPTRDPDLLKGKDISGKAVISVQPDFEKLASGEATEVYDKMSAFDAAVLSSDAAVEIIVVHGTTLEPESRLIPAEKAILTRPPQIQVNSEELRNWVQHPSEGRFVSVQIPAPEDQKTAAKNVIGILRGSDPNLKNTCVLITAHYDHIGTTETAGHLAVPAKDQNNNDHIYNGANDDASGTVSVIEIATAIARMNRRPKRSIVFMTFFGEERGELGSQYYARHPVFPMTNTIADVNLEQVGRTDSTTGPQVNTASLTGFDYSDLPRYFVNAGRETGVNVYLDKEGSDAYFLRSDNAAFAEEGVPAHTLTVAFDYPDYHGLGDEWQKIDYDNMARVDRMIVLALLRIANSTVAPLWNSNNPKTASFRQAQKNSRTHKDGTYANSIP